MVAADDHRERAGTPADMTAIELESLQLRSTQAPLVSIIIPCDGNLPLVAACLRSIAAFPPETRHEILVVDDASGDPAMDRLVGVAGIRYHRRERNGGLVEVCNEAAGMARGRYVFLLNSDTRVTAGWLDRSLEVLRRFPGCAAVGSKLVHPDGRLQEAGGIVWSDGTASIHGRGDAPDSPVYGYVREVDYCSAAALLVDREAFLRCGGFDRRYRPAYYEDIDLAFSLRSLGLKTYYCPASVVHHVEGGAHGNDLEAGAKRGQASNRFKFHAKWRSVLMHRHYRNGQRHFRARDAARRRQVVLVVDHTLPRPDRDAGSRAMLQTMQQLAAMGLLVKFWPDDHHYERVLARPLEEQGVEIVTPQFWGGSFETFIAEHGGDLDYAILSRPNFAGRYVPLLRPHSLARTLLYGHDLHYRRMRMQQQLEKKNGEDAGVWMRMFSQELALWDALDGAIYPSEEETAIVAGFAGEHKAFAVPLYCFAERSLRGYSRPLGGGTLLFVACFGHSPNEDAAEWLVNEILPMVRDSVPDARLRLVGSMPTARVRALQGRGVDVVADVSAEALAEEYRGAGVVIAPMRFGAGVKLKVLEAIAHGVPVVTTSTGMQGLDGGEDCAWRSDEASGLAAGIVRLRADSALADKLVSRGQQYLGSHYSEARMQDALWRALVGSPS